MRGSNRGTRAGTAAPARGIEVDVEDLEFRYPGGLVESDGGGDGFRLALPRFRVAPGEKVACVGPSGCGKSTLLALLAGILVPGRGRVRLDGREISAERDAARRRFRLTRIGLVFQELELLEHLSARENVLAPFLLDPSTRVDDALLASLEECAEAAGVRHLLGRRPRDLSHGERQRVALCRALVGRPGLLLADEPTGSLDARATRRVLDLLVARAETLALTVVIVTHDTGLLPAFDRVVDLETAGGERP